jgi:chromosome segregation ATPase
MGAPEYIKREYENGNLVKYIRHDLYEQLEQEIAMLRKANEGMSAACAESDKHIETVEQERNMLQKMLADLSVMEETQRQKKEWYHEEHAKAMQRVAELEQERDALKKECQLLIDQLNQRVAALEAALRITINFIPDGWEMPLGFNKVVSQAKQVLGRESK